MKIFERLELALLAYLAQFGLDVHAGVSVYDIVVVVLGFFLMAILTPVAMHQMQAANYTGVNSAVITVMTVVVPIIFAIGVALKFLPHHEG